MDLARALAADLRDLAVDLSAGAYTRSTLAMFERDLLRSVPSALGATVVLRPHEEAGPVVGVNLVSRTVQRHEIETAVRVPLRLAPPMTGSITFYAGVVGALAGLAADLARAFQLPPAAVEEDPTLPEGPVEPTVEGLQDFSEVNRALGVLMNRGHSLAGARAELDRRAAAWDVELVAAARAVLSSAYV